jgi:uncharacterized pyridoxamine 5'-phosphate oxidase family protein
MELDDKIYFVKSKGDVNIKVIVNNNNICIHSSESQNSKIELTPETLADLIDTLIEIQNEN